eukprot:scaffold20628_cov112-Isochrysis_galbana.AAC.1
MATAVSTKKPSLWKLSMAHWCTFSRSSMRILFLGNRVGGADGVIGEPGISSAMVDSASAGLARRGSSLNTPSQDGALTVSVCRSSVWEYELYGGAQLAPHR